MKQFVSCLLLLFFFPLRNRSKRDKKKNPKIATSKAYGNTPKKKTVRFSACALLVVSDQNTQLFHPISASHTVLCECVCVQTMLVFRRFCFQWSRHLVSRLFWMECFIWASLYMCLSIYLTIYLFDA